MDELIEMLHQLYPLEEALRAELVQTLKVKKIAKGGFLLKAGSICNAICYVQQGLFRCYYMDGTKELVAWFKEEGNIIFSVESFLKQIPSVESIQALEDAIVLYVDYAELQSFYLRYKDFNINRALILEHYYIEAIRDGNAIRYKTASQKFEYMLAHHPDLVMRVPGQYLAPFLGMHPVSLSNARKKVLGYKKKEMAN